MNFLQTSYQPLAILKSGKDFLFRFYAPKNGGKNEKPPAEWKGRGFESRTGNFFLKFLLIRNIFNLMKV
jgi:hypothetical protein